MQDKKKTKRTKQEGPKKNERETKKESTHPTYTHPCQIAQLNATVKRLKDESKRDGTKVGELEGTAQKQQEEVSALRLRGGEGGRERERKRKRE